MMEKEEGKKKFIFVDETPKDVAVGTHHGGDFGVYMSHKVAKLRSIHRGDEIIKESRIFANCIVYVNGVTNPPVEEVRRLVTLHGGECVNYRVAELSHFVCDYFTDAQLKVELSRQKLNSTKSRVFNVTSAWITESIKQGKRISEALFLPEGLRIKNPVSIKTLFQKSETTLLREPDYRKTSDNDNDSISTDRKRKVIEIYSPESPEAPKEVLPPNLTNSQQRFLSEIPSEYRSEALEQLQSFQLADIHLQAPVIDVAEEELVPRLQKILDEVFSTKHSSSSINRKLRLCLRSLIDKSFSLITKSTSSTDGDESHLFRETIRDIYLLGIWIIERNLLEQAEIMLTMINNFLQNHSDELPRDFSHEVVIVIDKLQRFCEQSFGGKIRL